MTAQPSSAGADKAGNLIARIDQQLRDLWKTPEDPGATPLSRVCTMNLEIVAESRDLLERYTPVVDEVTASIPARAILASIEPNADQDTFQGEATAVCSLEGDRKICSERVILAASGRSAARAASAIEALLVPEIPTALVWLGKIHVDDPIFEDLAGTAQRLIVDSEYTSLSSLLHLASWARQKETERPYVADLAWTRLAPWQELLARFFDDGTTTKLADKVTRISLAQACNPGARVGSETALLLGWVATRLGWKTSRLGGLLRFKRPDGGTVELELSPVPCPEGVAPQTLAALTIEAEDEGTRTVGRIRRKLASGLRDVAGVTTDADMVLWQQETSGAPPIEQHVRLGPNKAAKWLERTLHRRPHDPAFDESVVLAEQIVEDSLTIGGR
ncbi:hypothetical protein AKJ09_08564 [Labilithrix luteola]|uniref:Uncharacterized protein n=1 Tax=Labilithrix luteola TaxID=1391654 RepID=A0A0K1Q7V6_9BACT|nr:glucose-6-phosphate dehydrogenase assembly protein OpcA [Labilithrix luteola]AKV01901.1 hypothetical protein AKJ09_08564 [Labilithrix luteola]